MRFFRRHGRRAVEAARAVRESPRMLRTRPNDGRDLSTSERLREAIRESRPAVPLHITGLPPQVVGRLRRAQQAGEI